jgi:UDP-glucose 4-epimerase
MLTRTVETVGDMDMHVLVTGGLGVNGAPVLRKLVERGIRPVVIDTRADLTLLSAETIAETELVRGDFTDAKLIGDILKRHEIRTIIHMAAIVANAQRVPRDAFRVNAYGTVELLDIACTHGIKRFVFTSSRGVYGEQTGDYAHPIYRPVREDDQLRPARVYDVCKVAAEGMGRNYALLYGIEFIALRFATIFGPGKTLRHKNYGIISEIIENALAGAPVQIAKGGDQKDDLIYVEDAAEAIIAAACLEKPGHDVYNISHGVGVTLNDLADAIRAVVPEARIEIGPGLNYMGWDVNYAGVLDNSRAASTLGFRPRFNLKTAVADYSKRLRAARR